ncbi:hypothetical protein DPX39_080047500 [Trypanosoma brucei equiperdum]|uniref:EDRF1 N-terminal domain-containing protein n=1 Tax=Trypanosoma brucei equiperdum TaxID=630700 RepID=A0A3L6L480_9TRYP|nr:hypothetical protein DPX39_080047500 [Trypanosoma brucei equiperdum]
MTLTGLSMSREGTKPVAGRANINIHNTATDDHGDDGPSVGVTATVLRPSRRALHRRAVKRYNDKQKKEESKRLAEERDQKLLDVVGKVGDRTCGESASNVISSVSVVDKPRRVGGGGDREAGKHVLMGKWEFDFFFRTLPSELLRTCKDSSDVGNSPSQHQLQEVTPVPNPSSSGLYAEEEQSLVVISEGDRERPFRGSMPLKASAQSGALRGSFVRRVEGVPPLPMPLPLASGTDLDQPPWNYLVPDPMYNVHQYVPGFGRDEGAAKRSLLSCAVREWRGGEDRVLVLSTGEALRSVFRASYSDDRTLVLQVRRVGPTLLVDTHGEEVMRSGVRDMRMKSLLGKALYRILGGTITKQHMEGVSASNPSGQGVVALPMHRIGSANLTKHVHELSRYSHILHWEIGAMDALVGVDTPVVIDGRDNTEHVLSLRDTSIPTTPEESQHEALNTWFEATLANVPHVGVYVHHDGIVQRYEVRKAQEMLGLVERRMAATAMNFTTTVLQWLMTQCKKDGATYAVIQNYETGALEVYECFTDDHLERFLPEDGTVSDDEVRDSGSAATKKQAEEESRQREENERLNWGLATMCFRMGMHLKDSVDKAPDALSLLLRSFAVYFMQRRRVEEACPHICDILKVLPDLVGLVIRNKKAALEGEGGIIQLPEICREVFITCGRFGIRLQESVVDESLPLPTRRSLLQCLLPCSAALCVCVVCAIEQFCVERATYLRLKAGCGKSSDVHIHSLVAKDLLQVVVEGLLRLENMKVAVASGMELVHCVPACDVVKEHALIDTKTDIIDITPLVKTLWELYADVVLLAMSDPTPFTANVLVELSRRIKTREELRSEVADIPGAIGTSAVGESVLTWLSSITYDIVSLSYTALRFITKVGVQSKRLLAKTSQVYYHVGHHYLLTDRYTKALDSLHRAQSLFKVAEDAVVDSSLGERCTSSTAVTLKDVRYSLGETFLRMANLKLRLTSPTVTNTLQQPLAMGDTRPLSPEEDSFYRQAVDHFTHCEAREKLAFALRMYACRQISHIISSGHQGDGPKGRNICSMLRRASELTGCGAPLQWEVLRLFSCTAPHGALQRWSEELHHQWGDSAVSMGAGVPKELSGTVHPLEFQLQMALVAVGLSDTKGVREHRSLGFARSWAVYLTVALKGVQAAYDPTIEALLNSLTPWKVGCAHEWVYRNSLSISLRGAVAVARMLVGNKAIGAKSLCSLLGDMLNKLDERRNAKAVAACNGNCYSLQAIPALIQALESVTGW